MGTTRPQKHHNNTTPPIRKSFKSDKHRIAGCNGLSGLFFLSIFLCTMLPACNLSDLFVMIIEHFNDGLLVEKLLMTISHLAGNLFQSAKWSFLNLEAINSRLYYLTNTIHLQRENTSNTTAKHTESEIIIQLQSNCKCTDCTSGTQFEWKLRRDNFKQLTTLVCLMLVLQFLDYLELLYFFLLIHHCYYTLILLLVSCLFILYYFLSLCSLIERWSNISIHYGSYSWWRNSSCSITRYQ